MFEVFHNVHSVWEAQLKDIEKATEQIYLEQYALGDFGEGEIGAQYISALINKAKEGVKVDLILDFQGSFALFRSVALNEALKKAGVNIFYYKTLGWSRLINPFRVFLRDHRKLMVIDDNLTWIGGVVIGESYREWDDFMVRYDDISVTEVCKREFRLQLARLADKRSLLAPVELISEETHLIGNAPGIGNRFCYDEICHEIMLAQKSVTLITPYFVPTPRLLRVLNRRLSEGLEIILLTPRESDHKWVDYIREKYLSKLLKKGLILYFVEQMNHSKVILIDGKWMTFGSINLDPLSLIFNHELNITTKNVELIQKTEAVVHAWLKENDMNQVKQDKRP